MNRQIASTRLKDVLNVDSINSTQADFLSTHVPFRKIKVTNGLSGTNTLEEYMSEDQMFNKYFNNSELYNKHQLIVVDGSSGSGKSHFIRWINAKLDALDENKDVILMIRRSDNTLKGTIKQFLEIDEVKNIKNKDIYERLVKANQNVSEQKFKYEIYHKFLVEIADDDKSLLSASDRKNFRELLASSEFEEKMLMAGGPIERIYSKIVDSNLENEQDVLALFDEEDFTMDYDFNMRLKNNASKKAIKMANKLLPEADGSFVDEECNPKILVEYMNSKVEPVIKGCAGLEPGDFQQIFKEIRQELYKQGKNLVLLIEDITSCTGINRDLLDALIVEHTGSNAVDKMCRLVSVIGTTSEYFKEFRSNYLDRITTMITIEDGSIGNNLDDLIQFVAKYLNIMSISAADINTWYKDGAIEDEYPVHKDSEIEAWEYYNYHGKKLSLYPFTKRAIINLYNCIHVHKTPRYILRKIVEPAVDNIIQDKKNFPKFLSSKNSTLSFDVEARVKNTLANMQIEESEKDSYRDRIFVLLSYWGDGSLNTDKKGYIGAINLGIFKEFGLDKFAEKILGISLGNVEIQIEESGEDAQETTGLSTIVPEVVAEKPPALKTNKAFDDFARILSDWHYEKKSFIKSLNVREEIDKFIFGTIPWQREGVPLISKQMVNDSSCNLISIERQDRAIDRGLVLLEDSDDTYQLLLTFGKWLHLGKSSWNFDGAASSLRFVTAWLERNKNKFVEIVRAYDKISQYPDYIKCAIIAEVYRGVINGDYQINRIADIEVQELLKSEDERTKKNQDGHSKEWIELVNSIIYSEGQVKSNVDTIQRYFNLIQGNVKNASRKIINYTALDAILKALKKEEFSISIEDIADDKIKARNVSRDYLKKIVTRIDKTIAAESAEGKAIYIKVLEFLGFSDGTEIEKEDIKELLNEVIDFYKETEMNGVNIVLKTNEAVLMRDKSANIAKALTVLNMDMNEMSTFDKLIKYAQNPMKIVKQFLAFLEVVNEDCSKVLNEMYHTKEVLTRSGNWSNEVDPRFEENKGSFDELIKLMEG